ncbi:tigger transposable element-derived protein 1-like [Palaemon carinicauda]|uniref:tigger transposable element-derived protein 1-like n=1 Tax=Palaemon carinicauda TaxID=392227 RepID=UPI0035B69A3F
MPPKKASVSGKAGGDEKKIVRKTIEFKKELLMKYESGVRVSDLAKEFSMANSTISKILKNKDDQRRGISSPPIFNCDETGLVWKKMPRRTYITQEEKSMPGYIPTKDRFTLLLCGNASGDCKIKPLLIYHSENPRAFKANNIMKSKLPVMWRSNTKAWLTRQYFTEWVHEVFAPAVKRNLEEKKLLLCYLLVMDNAPALHPGLEDDLTDEFDFIKIKFLPPNTTPLLQPMNQQIITNLRNCITNSVSTILRGN